MALSLGLGLAVPRGATPGTPVVPGPPALPVSGAILDFRTDWYTWEDAARTVPALDDADKVQGWSDNSAAAHHLSQPTLAAAPTLQTAEAAGKPLLLFDGVDDALGGGDIAALDVGAGSLAVFVVVRGGATVGESGIVTKDTYTSGTTGLWIATSAANYVTYVGAYHTFGPNDGAIHLLGYRRASSGAFETRLYYDGALAATLTDGRTLANALPFQLGRFEVSGYFAGYVGDVSVFAANLSDADWNAMTSYLKAKFGIP